MMRLMLSSIPNEIIFKIPSEKIIYVNVKSMNIKFSNSYPAQKSRHSTPRKLGCAGRFRKADATSDLMQSLTKGVHVIILDLCFSMRNVIIDARTRMVSDNAGFAMLPDNKHWRDFHSRQKLRIRQSPRPSVSFNLSISKSSNLIKILRIH